MKVHLFGYMPDGTAVEEYTLGNGRLTAKILTLGGVIRVLEVEGRDIVCGYDALEDYLADDSHQGGIIGRYANRMRDARFVLGGKEYALAKNVDGKHHLHGGNIGFDLRVWTVEEADDTHITLSLLSPDGEEGYPANLFVKVTYTLTDDALMIAYNAISDGDTFVNLTNHAYFNLGGVGSGCVCGCRVQICADEVTELDEELVATGVRIPVSGTVFDFNEECALGARFDEAFQGYDINYVFRDAPMKEVAGIELPHVATLRDRGLAMEVYTDRPCAQLYTGNFLGGAPDFKGGVPRKPLGAVCFETQTEPNALNNGAPPLKAGELYHTVTVYRFAK